MKKVLALFLVACLCISVSACRLELPLSADVATIDVQKLPTEVCRRMDAVDSVRIHEEMEMSVNFGAHAADISGEAIAEFSKSAGIVHVRSAIENYGMQIAAELYAQLSGKNATVYMSMNEGESWGAYTAPIAAVAQTEGYHDDMEAFKVYLNVLTNIERTPTTHMGKSALLITGQVDYDQLAQFMMDAGFASAIAQGSTSFEEQIEAMYEDLSPVELAIYLDAASGLPLEIDMDATAMFDSFYANAQGTFGGMRTTVNRAYIKVTFEDYNNVHIEIPAAAKAAPVSGPEFGGMLPRDGATQNMPKVPDMADMPIEMPSGDKIEELFSNFGERMESFSW